MQPVRFLSQEALAPWQWPDSHWRSLVRQVQAGSSLRPKEWPNRARCAFALSFDSDHETSELRDGGESIARIVAGSYGNRVGIPRIQRILEQEEILATFYVPAVVALLYPEEQKQLAELGHEIGIHGWIHELNSTLSYEQERDLLLRSADTLEKISGKRPVGLRTPSWDFSPHTLRVLEEMNLLYDSSLMAQDDCHRLCSAGRETSIIELPVNWTRDDAVYFMMHRFQPYRPYTPPSAVFSIFLKEFEQAYEEGGVFQLTLHPHIIGQRSRIWMVQELIRFAKAKGDVWFATHEQIVRFVLEEEKKGVLR